ncbi:MAG: carboxypeptidase-like regulatory domain-containing protein [Paludibacteraceae bacterium]|nr:carboxypeptidase-like regulatory domain-containing protein [Paludibacteraceae bacterium]
MFRGKETCKILKQIRQNIASENDIPLVVEECHYKGECRGTCPRCEAELEYLERELMKRRSMGKKLVLAGLSAGLSWTPMAAAENIQVSEVTTQQDTTQNDERTILIKGTIEDSEGPIYGATVMIQGTTKSVVADFDGKYSIYVKRGDILEFSCVGYEKVVRCVDEIKSKRFDVMMKPEEIPSEVIVVTSGYVGKTSIDTLFGEFDNNKRSHLPSLIFCDEEYRSKDGKRNLEQDIQYHKVYPKVEEIKEDVEVEVRLVINADASLFEFKIVSSNDKRFNEAAMETIKRMDGWQCRKVKGKPVETKKTIKIVYRKEELQMLSKQKDEK